MSKQTLIISLGGSLIVPNGIDKVFLRNFYRVITEFVQAGNRVVIICGGGSLTREYQRVARSLNPSVQDADLDWIGIRITRVNAQLVRSVFGKEAYNDVIEEPETIASIKSPIVVGAGWKPGWSTDYVSVKCAEYLQVKEIVNLSNVAYIYDKDPKKYLDAKKMNYVTWSELQKIVGSHWIPGSHAPFDPIATKLAAKLHLRVVFLNGAKVRCLSLYLTSGQVIGSVVE